MLNRAPLHSALPGWRSRKRRALAVLLAALFLFLLTRIPYDMLRHERIRAFGEAATAGTVQELDTDTHQGHKRFLVTYAYRGQDGRLRRGRAPVPPSLWNTLTTGQRVSVYYATGQPNLSRLEGQLEPGFILWLRQAVRGDELPDNVPNR